MLRTILICAVAAVIAGGTAAYAGTSHVFGSGGQTYTFDGVCHRVSFVPPGISNHEAINVLGQQVKCLVRREAKIRNCYRRVVLAAKFDHGPGKPGDWTNVDELQKCGSL